MATLLLDEGISRDLARQLASQGFAATHWLDMGRKGAHDSIVFHEPQQRGLTNLHLES